MNLVPDQLSARLELLVGDEQCEEHGEEEVEDGDEDGGRVLDHQAFKILGKTKSIEIMPPLCTLYDVTRI